MEVYYTDYLWVGISRGFVEIKMSGITSLETSPNIPPPSQQVDQANQARMAQVTQFIRNLAFATPQQQEQLLQKVPLVKRHPIMLRAQQMRQQIQQQQQQQQMQQNYNPGGGGGIMGTGGKSCHKTT